MTPRIDQPDPTPGSPLPFCLVGQTGPSLFGLTTADRTRRLMARAGAGRELTVDQASAQAGPVLMVRADAAIDQPLIPLLLSSNRLVLVGEGVDGDVPLAMQVPGPSAASACDVLLHQAESIGGETLDRRKPADLKADFWKALRKRETPYAFAVTAGNAKAVEWRMFMGTYKGATDLVTKHLWPRACLSRHALPCTARHHPQHGDDRRPQSCTVLAFWLFLKGQFAAGFVAAWAMTFLDTVDGKLARTTLTSSKWGDIFDHGIDLVHPPFWYVAWALGLGAAGFSWTQNLLVGDRRYSGWLCPAAPDRRNRHQVAGTGDPYLASGRHAVPADDGAAQSESRPAHRLAADRPARLGSDRRGHLDGAVPGAAWPAAHAGTGRQAQAGSAHLVDDRPVTRAGLIVNPRSGKSSGKGLALAGMLRPIGNVSIKIIDRFDMIEGLVDELATEGVTDLFISSGDGTIQAIQTILAERKPFTRLPRLGLLPHGTTNMTAADLGFHHRSLAAQADFIRELKHTDLRARPTLRVRQSARWQSAPWHVPGHRSGV